MELNTDVFGTTGLPQFGPTAIMSTSAPNIEKLNSLFNKFIKEVGTLGTHGNDIPAFNFGAAMTAAYGSACLWVGGKPVVGNV